MFRWARLNCAIAMGTYRKRIVVVLMVVLLGGATALCFVQGEDVPAIAQEQRSGSGLLSGKEPNLTGPRNAEADTRELFIKMMVSVLVVAVLGFCAIFVSRRFLPRLTRFAGRRIRVIETVHLGPRKALHLVKVDGQSLLIGSTNEQIARLADLTEYEVELPASREIGAERS